MNVQQLGDRLSETDARVKNLESKLESKDSEQSALKDVMAFVESLRSAFASFQSEATSRFKSLQSEIDSLKTSKNVPTL